MQEKAIKSNLTVIGLVVSVTAGVFGFVGTFTILPYRINAAEIEIKQLKEERRADREILIRIEEQLKFLGLKIERMNTRSLTQGTP